MQKFSKSVDEVENMGVGTGVCQFHEKTYVRDIKELGNQFDVLHGTK